MLEDVTNVCVILRPIIYVLGVFIFGYMILLGFAYRGGRNFGMRKENKRRLSDEKPAINMLSKNQKLIVFWKDPGLIQGGFTALIMVIILLSFVLLMLLFGTLTYGETFFGEYLFESVSVLMLWSVLMAGVYVVMAIKSSKNTVIFLWVFILITSVVSIISVYIVYLILVKVLIGLICLIWQALLFLIQSICLSYVLGVARGVNEEDIDEQFSLVDVLTVHGGTICKLRLYERTDTDYRFIGEDSVEHIIPCANVREILHYPNDSEGSAQASKKSCQNK